MAKKKLVFILSAVVLVLIVLIKAIWFSSALVGDKSHDFGFIEVIPPKTTVDHTFTLTNKSGHDLILVDVVPDCGCTTTEAYQELIADGEELILPVQLKLRQSKLRKSTIRLVFEDGTIEVLTLRAVGRLKDSLRVSPSQIVLKEGEVPRGLLGIEQFDDTKPPTPIFTTPPGVVVHAQKWTLKSKRKPMEEIPANWSLQFELKTDAPIVEGAEITVQVGTNETHILLTNQAPDPKEVPFSKLPK